MVLITVNLILGLSGSIFMTNVSAIIVSCFIINFFISLLAVPVNANIGIPE